MIERLAKRLPVDMMLRVRTTYFKNSQQMSEVISRSSNSFLSQVHSKFSNRSAQSFCGIAVTKSRRITIISMRYRTQNKVRLLNKPRLIAVLARKHNTRARSSKIGTKENPFAAVNFARKLAADDLNRHGSNKNWRACGATPAGRRAGAATARLASLF